MRITNEGGNPTILFQTGVYQWGEKGNLKFTLDESVEDKNTQRLMGPCQVFLLVFLDVLWVAF